MKTTTNKKELKKLCACEDGYKKFVKTHGDGDALFSQCIDSNGWDDAWWLISNTYEQFTDEQKHDLRVFGCKKALINIEKIKSYCSNDDYKVITDYLNNPSESARSAAWSAAWSAWSVAESARSAESAMSAAESAAWSAAWSARSAAWSASMKGYTQELKELFLKWESQS